MQSELRDQQKPMKKIIPLLAVIIINAISLYKLKNDILNLRIN